MEKKEYSIKENIFYTRSGILINQLNEAHLITEGNLMKYYIHHFLDSLIPSDKLVIIQRDTNYNNNLIIEKELNLYFNERKIIILNQEYIVVSDTVKNDLYFIKDVVSGNINIQKGLDDYLTKSFKIPMTGLNKTFVSYYSAVKDSLVPVLKIKNVGEKKRKEY